jgi:hypothetical protein
MNSTTKYETSVAHNTAVIQTTAGIGLKSSSIFIEKKSIRDA